MRSHLLERGDNRSRLIALLVLVVVLGAGGVTWVYAAPASQDDSASAGIEAQVSPLYAHSLTQAVERFGTTAPAPRPVLNSAMGALRAAGKVHINFTYMTCLAATCGWPSCIGSTCVSCSTPTYSGCSAATSDYTCGSTCAYTCGTTCNTTCGATCNQATCADTCGAQCDDPDPPTGMNFARLSGNDRYETAVAISRAAWPAGCPGVVITTGKKFPDALAGASIAYAYGSLLLVGDTIPQVVKDEITRLNPSYAIILGQTDVVSTEIENYLKTQVDQTFRIGGADRYETAALIARETVASWTAFDPEYVGNMAIIATGRNFPDALAAAPMSAKHGIPILLVQQDVIPPATKAMLTELGITHTLIVGDVSVVNADVASQLPDPYRLGGATRYETMGKVVDFMWMNWGMGNEYAALAVGTNFPDALAGGAIAGGYGGVIYLTKGDALHPEVASRIGRNGAQLKWIDVYGGKNVLYPSVVTSAFDALN